MIDDEFKQSKEYLKIKQDVNRTVFGNEYFNEGNQGYENVLSVLLAFYFYDLSCGYV